MTFFSMVFFSMVFFGGGLASAASTSSLDPEDLAFVYQETVEPWSAYPCKHEKADVGVFEWDVYCLEGTTVHTYAVHLVVSRYAKTVFGVAAYEVLYWVTDRTRSDRRDFDSTTLWIHNSEEGNLVRVFELAQGVENDLATLRLKVDLR